MKRFSFIFTMALLTGFGLMLSSCGGSKGTTSSTPPPADEVLVNTYCDGPEYQTSSTELRSQGLGESTDQATSQKIAYSNAKAELAGKISTLVKEVTDNYVNQREMNNDPDVRERFESLTRTVVNQELQGVKTICKKVTKTKEGKFKTYLALELVGAELVGYLNEGISADDQLKIDYDYEKFKETFEKEMEEFSNR